MATTVAQINPEHYYTKTEVDRLVNHEAAKLIQKCSIVALALITFVAIASSSFSGLYTQAYGLTAGSALITFAVATCYRSQGIQNLRDVILMKNSHFLDKFRHLFFKSSFNYGKYITDLTNSPSFFKREIISRIAGLGISFVSAINLAQDIQHVIGHTINGIFSCITRWETPLEYPANYRNVALVAGEIFTHFIGTCVGSIVGVISPQKAVENFLPTDQTAMEQRPENMTKKEAGTLYGMMNVVDHIFTQHKMKYAITAGTALGKERHGGMIPWDDDIDLFLMESDEENFLNLKDELAKHDLAIIKCRIGYKIYFTKGKDTQEGNLKFKYPFIDIAIAQDINGKIMYRDLHSRQTYAGEYYTRAEWNNIEKVDFGPVKVSGLKDGSKFVNRCYGANAMDYGFTFLNHKTFGVEFPKKYLMNKNQGDICKPIEFDQTAFDKFKV